MVHQLIRQYVMATMLIDKLCEDKKVIPFVVGPNAQKLIRHQQVKFMTHQGWLNRNCLKRKRNAVTLKERRHHGDSWN